MKSPLAAMFARLWSAGVPEAPPATGVCAVDETVRVQRGVWLHATLPRPSVATTPHEVIHRQNKLAVRYYAARPAARHGGPPVVVVPSLINRAWIVDLEPDRSLVAGLAALGHDVYMVDWGVPGPEDATTTVADVLLDLLDRAVRRSARHAALQRGTAPGPVHLLGYCQGGTLSVMYAALRTQRVASLAVFNAPTKFSEGGRFHRFVSHIDVDAAFRADRLVGVDLMRSAFKLLDPMGNWGKYLNIERDSHDPRRLARTLARERWLEENVPMPGTFAREFIRRAYQDDALLAGTWVVGGERVDLQRFTGPLLVVACERDFIAPQASVIPLAHATGSRDVTAKVLDVGHIGIVVGAFGPRVFYPLLDAWFRGERSDG